MLDGVERASGWERVEGIPPLADGVLQLWRLDARGEAGERLAAAARAWLSAAELGRLKAMRLELARREFAAGRALLRRLLGAALGCDPKDVAFGFGENGKPRVAAAAGVEFNLSHSGGMVLAGIARGVGVGVDVERIDPEFAKGEELLAIADASFAVEERTAIRRAAAEPERMRAFYAAWTRKEAILKAFGLGIAGDVPEADKAAGGQWAVRDAVGEEDLAEEEGCFVRSVEVAAGYAGAVAVAGARLEVRRHDAGGLFGESAVRTSE